MRKRHKKRLDSFYIRRGRLNDRTESLQAAFRLAAYMIRNEDSGNPFYVMVHRKKPAFVIGVASSKRELADSVCMFKKGVAHFYSLSSGRFVAKW